MLILASGGTGTEWHATSDEAMTPEDYFLLSFDRKTATSPPSVVSLAMGGADADRWRMRCVGLLAAWQGLVEGQASSQLAWPDAPRPLRLSQRYPAAESAAQYSSETFM